MKQASKRNPSKSKQQARQSKKEAKKPGGAIPSPAANKVEKRNSSSAKRAKVPPMSEIIKEATRERKVSP